MRNSVNQSRAEKWGEEQRERRRIARLEYRRRLGIEGFREEEDGDSYVMRVLLALDQLGNAIMGGDEDETISSRIGKAKLRGDLPLAVAGLDVILDLLDPNHSIDAIEFDEGLRPELAQGNHD